MKTLLPLLVMLFVCVTSCVHTKRQRDISNAHMPAIPTNAISGLLAAFDKHAVVTLGEGAHGNEQGHAFRLSLIRDPRFQAIVNDIVVEFGAAQNQSIIDRYISGEEVPYSELSKVWRDTTQIFPVWDVPIYEEFYRAVREVNKSRPKERRLRVLLGDPPVDWNKKGAYGPSVTAKRDSHAADLIQREVLAEERRALVIYGDWHFFRRQVTKANIEDESDILPKDYPPLVALLESQGEIRVYNITTYTRGPDLAMLQLDAKSWPAPSLIQLRGTILGAQQFGFYLGGQVQNMGPDGVVRTYKILPEFKMEDQFDAILYLGPTSSITVANLPAKLCLDPAWLKMRKHRANLVGGAEMAKFIEMGCEELLKHDASK